jgi:dihydrofolate synthase/folylpolyglutamate synthase
MDGPGRARTELGPAWARLVDRLEARSRLGMVLGLDRLSPVLAALGHPERSFAAVHVAGSNGKGSTSAFLAALLSRRGRRVGLYTSPHLISLTERVQVVTDAVPQEIDGARLIAAFDAVERVAPDFGELTFFEVITAAGLVALAELGVEVAVIEAGIGAKNDATRAVDAVASVLTELTLEHTQILGDTLAAIARDKAAVLRPGRPAVVVDAPEQAAQVIEAEAARVGAPLLRLGRELRAEVLDDGQVQLGVGARRFGPLTLSLLGPHQARNAALATAAALCVDPTLGDDEVHHALTHTRWPGRMEVFARAGRPPLLLDGAHNAQGVEALVRALTHDRARFGRPLHLVFAVLGDKDAAPMIAALAPHVASLTLTRPSNSTRARAPEELRALLPSSPGLPCAVVPVVAEALAAAEARAAQDGGWVVVAGSLYLVGEVRAALVQAAP